MCRVNRDIPRLTETFFAWAFGEYVGGYYDAVLIIEKRVNADRTTAQDVRVIKSKYVEPIHLRVFQGKRFPLHLRRQQFHLIDDRFLVLRKSSRSRSFNL